MNSDHLIHLKFDYYEALEAKKDILYSEKELISLERTIKSYRVLRAGEMKFRVKLQKKVSEFLTSIKKLQKSLPKVENPEILERTSSEKFEKVRKLKEPKFSKEEGGSDIESQLREIQRKLSAIHG